MSDRGDSFDRGDFQRRQPQPSPKTSPTATASKSVVWPVEQPRVGQSVMADRNGKGRPHEGLDLFVDAGSAVRAAVAGTVLRVLDGRNATDTDKKRAGLWIDIVGDNGLVYRYLHLGTAQVAKGERVSAGTQIGTVANRHESGSGQAPHLHFEIREGDWSGGDYGKPRDPLQLLNRGIA